MFGGVLATAIADSIAFERMPNQIGHGTPRTIRIHAPGYPKQVRDRLGNVMVIHRGISKEVRFNSVSGEALREIRARNGVGRPPGTVSERMTPEFVNLTKSSVGEDAGETVPDATDNAVTARRDEQPISCAKHTYAKGSKRYSDRFCTACGHKDVRPANAA